MKYLPILIFSALLSGGVALAQPKIQLADFSTGFTRPVDIAHCGDSRLFIVEQRGLIWVVDSLGKRVSTTPFLDIDAQVNSTSNEQGLLGLAFHPNYQQNGFFYVNYIRNDGDTHVSRFRRDPTDANKADPNSEKILLYVDQPFSNHNGGCLKFGPDGYLYISLGDGGSGGDPQGNGQKKNTFLGKILRINVDAGDPYTVPVDNPFVNDPSWKPEIWSTGLRNPWRISFDRLTGDLWIGDVGQTDWEEIDFQPVGVGGHNFGWRCYEGNHPYNTAGCQPQSSYIPAVFEYDNNALGCSVTGGFVYRGSKYPELSGTYLFTDYCSGRWWTVNRNANGVFSGKQIADLDNFQYSALGEDRDGELYVASLGAGKILKITELCSKFTISGAATDEGCTGPNDGAIQLTITDANGLPGFAWSNGATTQNLANLSAGGYAVTVTDGIGCVRVDSFKIIRQMALPAPQFIALNVYLSAGRFDTLHCPTAPAGMGYQWYRDGQAIAGGQVQHLPVAAAGAYQVAFTGTPCNSALSAPIIVHGPPPPLPILKVSGDSTSANASGFGQQWLVDTGTDLPREVATFSLRPNPTTGMFFLKMELSAAQKIAVRLSDAADKTLLTADFFDQKIAREFDLNALPPGTYYLSVRLERGGFVRKVVKI